VSPPQFDFNPDKLPELHDNFTDDSDGTPATADSGQTWTITYGPTSASKPTVSDGRFVINTNASGVAAGYLTAPLAASITWMEADFDFSSGGATDSQAAGLVAWSANLPSGEMGKRAIPDTAAHVAFISTGFTFSVGDCLTSLGFTSYGSTFKTQHVEIAIDKPNSIAYVRGADGNVHAFKHSLIGIVNAPYATAEVYYNAANTDNRVRFQRFAATSTPMDALGRGG
jgi:hypothetical protein